MYTITLLNEKGGVGKTTMATLLASMLASYTYKTLLIDGDSQGHATLSVRQKRFDGLYAFLAKQASFNDVVRPVAPEYYEGDAKQPALWLIPGSDATAQLAKELDPRILKQRLEELQSVFDFVVIDTSPSISDLHLSFYMASDYILYPTECTYMAINGLIKSLTHLEKAREMYQAQGYNLAQVLGIIPTKFSGRESVQHENHGWLRGKYGDNLILSPVRRRTAWEKASQMRVPIYMLEPSSEAASEAEQFVQEVLQRLEVTA